MRPPRVLHVIPSLALEDGGPTRALLEMERSLASAGIEVTTLTTVGGNGRLPPGPAQVRRVSSRRWLSHYKVAPGMVVALPDLLRRHDVVHTHALFSFAPNVAALAARWTGVPYVIRPLGTLGAYGLSARRPGLKRLSLARIESPLLRAASAVQFTSVAERDEALALGIPMRDVVIPLGLPPPATSRDRFDHPAFSGRTVLLFLSRLDPKKSLDRLIEALAGSESFRASGVLAVAGEGPRAYVDDLKARAKAVGVADRIVWLGHLDGSVKAALLATAHIFVLPSLSENFGIAAVEALAAGLPCILGRGVAISREVAQADAGVMTEPDPGCLRAALDGLIASPDARTRMGLNARRLAAERYSSAAMTRRLVELYEEVAASRARR